MANTLGIVEVTLAQIADSAHAVNAVDPTGVVAGTPRKWEYQPVVVRITDHQDNDGSETGADTDKMALFYSKCHGEPWEKQANVLEHVSHSSPAGAPVAAPANASRIYPDFDYAVDFA